MNGRLGNSVYKGRRIRLLPCIGTGKKHTAAFHHHGPQFFDHEDRHGKIGVYDPCPFLKTIVLIFRIGADPGVAYQPVNMISPFFQLFQKPSFHHRKTYLPSSGSPEIFFPQEGCPEKQQPFSHHVRMLQRSCLLSQIPPGSFWVIPSHSGGTACDQRYSSHR